MNEIYNTITHVVGDLNLTGYKKIK